MPLRGFGTLGTCGPFAGLIDLVGAMAAGRPMVATRVGGIPELVTDSGNGFLVAPRRRLRRLVQLLEDPALRARMGAAGRLAAERTFDLECNLDSLMRAYGFE